MSILGRINRGRRRRRARGGLSPVAAGAILLTVVIVLSYLGFSKAIPFRQHFELNAVFLTSNNLIKNSPVRIAGVEVGRVSTVEPVGPGGGQYSRVTMRIQRKGRPIHTDATAKIRPRIFLEGNFFVDLTPGSPSAPIMDDGETIPVNQTSTPVQFDQVLAVFKQDTRQELVRALAELGSAYGSGLGRSINRSFEFQPAAFQYTSVVNDALIGEGPHDLSDWIRDQGVVAAAIDSSPRRLKGLLRDFNTTAGALAAERRSLRATFDELPTTLITAKPALDSLNRSFPDVRLLAREALPGVRSSGPTIDVVLPLVNQLRGLVGPEELQGLSAELRRTIPDLADLAQATVPLLRQVRRASSCQNEVILPWTKDRLRDPNFPATGQVYEEAVKFLPGLAGESRSADANGPWFKVLGSGGIETFQLGDTTEPLFGTGLFPLLGSNPPKPQGRSPLRPDVPCETQEPPDLRTNPGVSPRSVGSGGKNSKATRERQARATEVVRDHTLAGILRDRAARQREDDGGKRSGKDGKDKGGR